MDAEKTIEYLSPLEKKIIPFLKEKNVIEICKKTNLDKTSVLRALEFLQNKNIVQLSYEKIKLVEIGVNGAFYKKKGLPERRLLHLLENKKIIQISEAAKQSELSDDEFKAAIGALKKKAMIDMKNEKIILNATSHEISKKMLEESFIELLPINYSSLTPEQLFSLQSLQKRKDIIQISEDKITRFQLTEQGKEIIKHGIKTEEMIEILAPEIIKNESLK